MLLKEFIKETLSQIIEGVKEAQEECRKMGAIVNPRIDDAHDSIRHEKVSFEVLLSGVENNENKKGIGVWLSSVGVGVNQSDKQENSTHTKVSFDVYVQFPIVSNSKTNESALPVFDLNRGK